MKVNRYDGWCRSILRALDRLAMQGQVDTGWMLVFLPGGLGRWMIVMTGGIRVFDRGVAGCTVVLTQDMGYNIHGKMSLFANAQPKLGPGGNIGPEQDHKGRGQGGYANGSRLAHEKNVPDYGAFVKLADLSTISGYLLFRKYVGSSRERNTCC